MATVTRVTLTCDLCGDAEDVRTWAFGLDGKAYEIDLCRKDGTALDRVAARYMPKARKVSTRPGHLPARQRSDGARVRETTTASGDSAREPATKVSGRDRVNAPPRQKAGTSRSERQAPTAGGTRAKGAGAKKAAQAGRLQNADRTPAQAPGAADVRRQRGIYVYGILPGDIEVTEDTPGVGEHPGLLRDIRFDGLAALISDVDMSGRQGSPEDLNTYREILDATAAEVPVVPLRFGTILTSEDAVAEELLAARHDEFTAALEQLEGRAEFQVKGRYAKDAVLEKVLSQNKRAARLCDTVEGMNPDAAQNARIELDQLINEAVTAWRDQDKRALRHAMEGVCAASVTRQPAGELDAVNVAFLVDAGQEREVDRVIEALAREWEGRIDLQLLGPMAAYDFTGTPQPEG